MQISTSDNMSTVHMSNARLYRISREGQSACPDRPDLHTIRIVIDDKVNQIQLNFSEAEGKKLKAALNKRKDL